jgi:hypothetical protein
MTFEAEVSDVASIAFLNRLRTTGMPIRQGVVSVSARRAILKVHMSAVQANPRSTARKVSVLSTACRTSPPISLAM